MEPRDASRLWVDFLDDPRVAPGRLGLAPLPGRPARGRNLPDDLASLRDHGVAAVLSLVEAHELDSYGVPDLFDATRAAGFDHAHVPIVDLGTTSVPELARAIAWLDAHVDAGRGVVVHCVGGLGRSGLVAACWLRSRGAAFEDALRIVRAARGPRAVETRVQEATVAAWTP